MSIVTAVIVAATATTAATPPHPHIVLVNVDELGTGDVPWSDHALVAPTIKRLGETGLRLGTQYAWHWCAPTRGALMTGRYPMHTHYDGGGMPGDGQGMPLKFPLLPGELKAAGYATHMIGKYHLGFRTPRHLPTSRGFDSYFGLLGGGADHYTKVEEGATIPVQSCANITSDTLPFRVDFFDGDKPAVDLWDNTTYDAYQYAERAVDLVTKHDPSTPFFLYWAPHKVHSPLQVPEEFLKSYPIAPGTPCKSTPETCTGRGYGPGCGCDHLCYCNRRVLRGMIGVVDEMIFNLTTALEERGMWNDTYLFFIGDNGAPINNAGNNGEFIGMKNSHWEGGHRVPSFVASPRLASTRAGAWYNGTVHLVDLHATILDLAGLAAVAPPGVVGVDGVTVLGVINGSQSLTHDVRTELWIADDVLRVGDYKIITGAGTNNPCMVGLGGLPARNPYDPNDLRDYGGCENKCTGNETGTDAVICGGCRCHSYNASDPACKPCLFNVATDPGESVNLAAQQPDRVADMMQRIVELTAAKTPVPLWPSKDLYASCKAMVDAGGFFVPWAESDDEEGWDSSSA